MENSIEYSDRMLTEAEAALDKIDTLSGAAPQIDGKDVDEAIEDELHGVRSALSGAASQMYGDIVGYLEHAAKEVDVETLRNIYHGLNILHGYLY